MGKFLPSTNTNSMHWLSVLKEYDYVALGSLNLIMVNLDKHLTVSKPWIYRICFNIYATICLVS